MMPGVSGIDLIRQVRVIQPDLPAVIVTGYTELAEFDPVRHGAVLIHKPFKRDALVAHDSTRWSSRRVGAAHPAARRWLHRCSPPQGAFGNQVFLRQAPSNDP